MTRYKLTVAGKVLVFLIVAGIAVGALYFTGAFNGVKNNLVNWNNKAKNGQTNTAVTSQDNPNKTAKAEMDISLDEWIGWKSILDANGGLNTKKGSIYVSRTVLELTPPLGNINFRLFSPKWGIFYIIKLAPH